MKSYITCFAFILIALIAISCQDNPVDGEAHKTTLDDIRNNPGFSWFEYEFNEYEPDPAVIDSINHKFNPAEYRLIIFAKPSCSCNNDHNNFSHFMKVVHNSSITSEEYELYSMSDTDWEHPYNEQFDLMYLPEAVLMKNDSAIWFVVEEMQKYRQSHSDTISIEQSLMRGLEH
ncbi:MAG: hypothetical protein ACLFQX_06500 [Candidatus Kapaibacterium sp.]